MTYVIEPSPDSGFVVFRVEANGSREQVDVGLDHGHARDLATWHQRARESYRELDLQRRLAMERARARRDGQEPAPI